MEHTPGPWEWEHDGYSSAEIFTSLRQEGDDIATIIAPHVFLHPETGALQVRLEVGNSWDADARLIAAAPVLLAACKLALDWEEGRDCGCHNVTTVTGRLRDAIAKAEGR